jgi:hypothetical protein
MNSKYTKNNIQLIFLKSNNFLRIIYSFFLLTVKNSENRKLELFKRLDWLNLSYKNYKYLTLKNLKNVQKDLVYENKTIEVAIKSEVYKVNIPKVNLLRISNCFLIAGSPLILKDDIVYIDYVFEDLIPKSYKVVPIFSIKKDELVLGIRKEPPINLDKVIYIDSFWISNYYHLLFDSLAKLDYLNKKSIYLDYKIAVNEDLLKVPHLYDLTVRLSNFRDLIILKKHQLYLTEECIYIERANYLPPLIDDFLSPEIYGFHPEILDFLKSSFTYKIITKSGFPRVIISRGNTLDIRINEDYWFTNLIKYHGFRLYYPEQMSLTDQINLFFNAKIVIAATGAALVNVIFMKRGATMVSINEKYEGFSMYRNLAIQLGVKFVEPIVVEDIVALLCLED